MKLIIQRVSRAEVRVEKKVVGKIGKGVLIFIGVGLNDTHTDAEYLATKVSQLRMFEDEAGKMNLSLKEVEAEALVVSQFTLYGDCRKGRRPSFDKAADPQKGEELYYHFINVLRDQELRVETGQFQAMMDVELINDGPVTFILDNSNK